MKICAIGLRGIPDVMGGIESHCQQLYPKMVKQGAKVTVLARSPYVKEKRFNFEGVEVISVWALRHKLLETFLHTFIAIIYARLFVRPDIVHLHAVGPAIFTPLARLLGMKVMVTHHGADYDRQKWSPFAKKVLRFGEKMGIVYGNAILVVGRTLTERLKLRFPEDSDKIQYVPNGMLPKFAEDVCDSYLPRDLGLQPGNYVLAVGRLVPEKGFHDLVQAHKKSKVSPAIIVVTSFPLICVRLASTQLFETIQSESVKAVKSPLHTDKPLLRAAYEPGTSHVSTTKSSYLVLSSRSITSNVLSVEPLSTTITSKEKFN